MRHAAITATSARVRIPGRSMSAFRTEGAFAPIMDRALDLMETTDCVSSYPLPSRSAAATVEGDGSEYLAPSKRRRSRQLPRTGRSVTNQVSSGWPSAQDRPTTGPQPSPSRASTTSRQRRDGSCSRTRYGLVGRPTLLRCYRWRGWREPSSLPQVPGGRVPPVALAHDEVVPSLSALWTGPIWWRT